MAKLIGGILGGISGKIGPIEGVNGKSGPYIRQAKKKDSKKVKKRKPQSPGRIAARARFNYLNSWLKRSNPVISAGFAVQNPERTSMQSAFTRNWPAVQGEFPEFSFDFSKVLISGGSLPQPPSASVMAAETGILDFSWTVDQQSATTLPTDQCMVLVYFPEMEESCYEICGSLRYKKTHRLELPSGLSGKIAEAYLGFRSDDRKSASDSQYLGQITIL